MAFLQSLVGVLISRSNLNPPVLSAFCWLYGFHLFCWIASYFLLSILVRFASIPSFVKRLALIFHCPSLISVASVCAPPSVSEIAKLVHILLGRLGCRMYGFDPKVIG